MSRCFIYQPDFGAEYLGEGRTSFRLWAPEAQSVMLKLADREAQQMQADKEGWHELITAAHPGMPYRYLMDINGDGHSLSVPDPASRAQAGDVHDDSLVVDPSAFSWRHAGWTGRPWHESIIYELHVGACGGFAGVTKKLPGLAQLGITAVELMPIADFPGPRNWGYDGVLLFAPDNAYGTTDELKTLVDTAHGLNMMVFLDVVYNHFGPDGNYLGRYAPNFFRDDIATPWGQAINFRHPTVREFYIENALYWLCEYRFDGLRFDAVHEIHDADFMPALAKRLRFVMPQGRHVHLLLENDRNDVALLEAGFDAQWNDDGHHVLHLLLTGEAQGYYADYKEGAIHKLARCLSEGFVYQGEASTHRQGAVRGSPSGGLPSTAFVLFLQNHDQIGNRAYGERLTTLAHPQALRAAYALLLLSPQIPMLFMGEERGSEQPFLYFTSHGNEELAAAVCAGRRQEFKAFAEFAAPGAEAAIPDPGAEKTFHDSIVDETDNENAQAWLTLTRELLTLRQAYIAPRLKGARALTVKVLSDAALIARWRLGDGSTLTMALNLDAQAVAVDTEYSTYLLSGKRLYARSEAHQALAREQQLPGYAFLAAMKAAT